MASRALLQRVSSRRAIGTLSRTSTLSGSHYSSITRCSSYNAINLAKSKQLNNFVHGNRLFSTASQWNKELRTMSEDEISGLKVQEERLMRDLHETCEWGKGERWGR